MKTISEKLSKLKPYEPYIFYLFILIHLLPVFLIQLFPTVDGPAHLYNARVIVELLTNDTSPLKDYYIFNSSIVPNWTGHFFLSLLLLFFSGAVAEKIFLAAFIVFMPLSFRYIFKVTNAKEVYLSYFVFPFIYSFLFFYGFYNFLVGLVFLFFAIALWLKYSRKGWTYARVLGLSALAVILYFSHLFVLLVFLLFTGIYVIVSWRYLSKNKVATSSKEKSPGSLLLPLLMLLPACILVAVNLISSPIMLKGEQESYTFAEIMKMLYQIQPAKGINYGKEDIFTKWVFFVFVLLCLYQLFVFIKFPKNKSVKKETWLWGILTALILLLLFILPAHTGSIGFITSRLLLMFFLFFVLYLSTLKTPLWLSLVAFIVVSYVNISLLRVYVKSTQEVHATVQSVIKASEKMKPHTTVLSVNDNEYWLLAHFSNYLGIDKPLVILNNYEADLNYFPLRWHNDRIPQLHLGNPDYTVEHIPYGKKKTARPIDYVFVMGPQNALTGEKEKEIKPMLEKYYELKYKNTEQNISLYRMRD